VIENVDPSVVSIQHEKAGGTGFIISEDGYILSNGHVVRGSDAEQPMEPAKSITVILNDERKYPAKVLGFSMDPDVALLKITPDEPLRPVQFADSTKAMVGQRVFAVGTPVGLKRTFTSGILSNTERTDLGTETVVFQTDAAINSGNSGGPLFTRQGRVLGINTYASRGQNNLGFTIPIHVALAMVEDLKTRGRFVRSLIPIYFTSELYDELSDTLGVDAGVLVTYVMQDSSAWTMGLRPGDVIVERNGEPLSARTKAELLQLEWQDTIRPAGEEVTFTVVRGAPGETERLTLTGVMEELPPMPAFARHVGELHEHRYENLGLGVEKLTPLHQIIHEAPADAQGVFVKTVVDNSVASRADIKENDILSRVDGKEIRTIEEFRAALDRALSEAKGTIEVEIVRRKLRLVTAMAPDYLLKGRRVVMVVPGTGSADVDLLRRELLARGADIRIATPGKADIQRPELETPIKADLSFEKLPGAKADILLLTGGEGSRTFWENEHILEAVRNALKNDDRILAAVGPSALLPVLASEEELELNITLPRDLSGEVVRRGGSYTGKDVETDKKLITTTGVDRSILREFLQAILVADAR
jgi:S1-C subfamily serine protease